MVFAVFLSSYRCGVAVKPINKGLYVFRNYDKITVYKKIKAFFKSKIFANRKSLKGLFREEDIWMR